MRGAKLDERRPLLVLGAGIAGLAVAHYARRAGWPVTVLEGSARVSGNAHTFAHGAFRFDSGAHRLHDKDPAVTDDVRALLGDALVRAIAPSQVCWRGQYLDFPLAPLNLFLRLGARGLLRSAIDLLRARAAPFDGESVTFEQHAVKRYGRYLAEEVLLNYSEKLWGLPAARLSPGVATERLKGLDLKTFVVEALAGARARSAHLDGAAFYYPRGGIGALGEALLSSCGREHVRLGARVTRIRHDGERVVALEVNGREEVAAGESVVVSTLPLSLFTTLLDPAPPPVVLAHARGLRFRSLLLVALFLERGRVTKNATVYFPERELPFTRVCEPVNRDPGMAPPGRTSVVAELPTDDDDALWAKSDDELVALVRDRLVALGWFSPSSVSGAVVERLRHAYPVLEVGYEERVRALAAHASTLENLRLSGRNGRFAYAWLHDMMRSGKDLVGELAADDITDPAGRNR